MRQIATGASRLSVITLALTVLCAAAPSGDRRLSAIPAADAARHPKTTGRLIAQKYLSASRGGRLRAQNGVELRIAPHIMRRNGVARIRQLSPRRFDIHIFAPWKGTVTVLLPLGDAGESAVSHRVRGRWIVEPTTSIHGRARLRVRSLSVFDTNEQLRYAVETMNLSYTAFLARKSDFYTTSTCDNRWPEAPGDPPTSEGCRKPPPYNSFDWTDDGCSSPTPASLRGPIRMRVMASCGEVRGHGQASCR
jgi:hypothetical protein